MKKLFGHSALVCVLAICLKPALNGAPAGGTGKNDVLISAMQQELHRAQSELGKLDPAPYFISYSVYDQDSAMIVGSQGSVINSIHARRRSADVIVRVGAPALDNTHEENRASALTSGSLPLDNDRNAIAHVLWQLTYGEYRKASQAYLNVKTTTQVHAQEADTSPDFSQATPQSHADYKDASPAPDHAVLEAIARRYSAYFRKYPYIYSSDVVLTAQRTQSRFVSTEDSRVVTAGGLVRLAIEAETRADDGMELMRVETFQAESAGHLPSEVEIAARMEKMASDLKALRAAPVAEPFDGPALLSGRAAAVFFHEVLGHRLEGHRQRGETEGQTFTKKVNQPILPKFLSVYDDPTLGSMNGIPLAGSYSHDDEGVPAEHVSLIQDGILKNFLLSRMPIKDFSQSNGHGRNQPGLMPTGRQGNLIVTSTQTVPEADMRQKLIDEVKKQNKQYGLYFDDIQGGFTLTQRSLPQAFQVLPVIVYKVYADGRPDELVRGV